MSATVYWAFLDGLRAFAVTIVILFHLEVPGFEGGFVGVDMFFVISGFIVTHVNIPSIRSGSFRLKDFYLRRAKRLMPELYLVMSLTVVTGIMTLPESNSRRLPVSGMAQTVFGSNIRYWLEAEDYFGVGARRKPLLHTWSLSVEEQYYFLFPLIASFLRAPFKFTTKFIIFFGVFLSSFLAYLLCQDRMESFTFFLLPTRVWEFAIGVAIAIAQEQLLDPSSPMAQKLSKADQTIKNCMTLGAFLCLISGLISHEILTTFYKPLTLIFPVAATGVIIGICSSVYPDEDENPTYIAKALSFQPAAYLGKLSYSMYLWHWPLICIAQNYFSDTSPENLPVFSGIIILTGVLSFFSFEYVTTPIRNIPTSTVTKSWSTVASALAPIILFLCLCFVSFIYLFPEYRVQLVNSLPWN